MNSKLLLSLPPVLSPFAVTADVLGLQVGAGGGSYDISGTTRYKSKNSANENVRSPVELKRTDVTLYYEILDNFVSVDLGLNANYIDSQAWISGATCGA